MQEQYRFAISLSVLNHLGRNLYRNIITVIGEAVSNSWDADANNVWINIDKKSNTMLIEDDGIGMNSEDFQRKFLKIGYSKRRKGNYKSNKGRPYIGRKGIGKLALLSCAEIITVVSQKQGEQIVRGTIDNSNLDKAITEDDEIYILEQSGMEISFEKGHGTAVYFNHLTKGMYYTLDYLKAALALYFQFSIIDDSFNIFLNNELINEKKLDSLAKETQYCWTINGYQDNYIHNELGCGMNDITSNQKIQGYIASVKKPSNLKIRGTQEKATVDLFVNGRLREKDILRHINTSRIVENYVYGQIHCDSLDQGLEKDIFTSSREGVKFDEPEYKELLSAFENVFREVIESWDAMRRKQGDDGDPDNTAIPKKARKAQELFNQTIKDLKNEHLEIKDEGKVDEWIKSLSAEAQFNVPSYTECFIAENLLREYIRYTKKDLSDEASKEADRWREKERLNKGKANISFDIRESTEDLAYLDMDNLAYFVDKVPDKNKDAGISRSAITYKPIRDAVGHTAVLTDNAKQRLNNEFGNIRARLIQILNEFDKTK